MKVKKIKSRTLKQHCGYTPETVGFFVSVVAVSHSFLFCPVSFWWSQSLTATLVVMCATR